MGNQELLGRALRFGLSSYDAACLELALRLQPPVAAADVAPGDVTDDRRVHLTHQRQRPFGLGWVTVQRCGACMARQPA